MPYYLEALSLFMLHRNIIWEKCFYPSIAVWELTISPNGASLVVIMGKNGVANDNFNATKPPIITATSSPLCTIGIDTSVLHGAFSLKCYESIKIKNQGQTGLYLVSCLVTAWVSTATHDTRMFLQASLQSRKCSCLKSVYSFSDITCSKTVTAAQTNLSVGLNLLKCVFVRDAKSRKTALCLVINDPSFWVMMV